MGLAFDLAEAINIGIGIAGGAAVKPLETRAKDLAFRRRLAQKALADIEFLKGANKGNLTALFSRESFWTATLQGDFAKIDSDKDFAELVATLASTIGPDDIPALGRDIGALFDKMALEEASPIDKVLYALISGVEAQQRISFAQLGAEIAVLSDTHAGSSKQADEKIWDSAIPVPTDWFVGRERELAFLRRTHQARINRHAIVGTGGIGKSMLAAKHVWSVKDSVDIAWWLQADIEHAIVDSLCELGRALHIDWPTERSPEKQARAVLTALGSLDRNWLIVYDNGHSARTSKIGSRIAAMASSL